MPYINSPSSLPRFVDICQRVPPALALPRCGLKRRTPRTRANRAAAASQVVTIWPISMLLDMCSTMHLSVVKFRCFGSGWVIRRYMFRGVSGLLHWVMKGSLGSLQTGHLERVGQAAWVRYVQIQPLCTSSSSWQSVLFPAAKLACQCRVRSTKLCNILFTFCALGKQGLPHLTRCHVLVVCNYARRPNVLLSFLFFSCGMDKCWRSLSADQLVI